MHTLFGEVTPNLCNAGEPGDPDARKLWVPQDGGPCPCGGTCALARAALRLTSVPLLDPNKHHLTLDHAVSLVDWAAALPTADWLPDGHFIKEGAKEFLEAKQR